MDDLTKRVAARFILGEADSFKGDEAANDRVSLEEGERSIEERTAECAVALRRFLDAGGFKWDAFMHAVAYVMQNDKVHIELTEYWAPQRDVAVNVLKGMADELIAVDSRPKPGDVAVKDDGTV
jgi:hypothetical protein